jgi:HAD superfamily hydrolase (TIGR01509 family)
MELGNITPIQGFTSILNDLHNKSDPAQILSIWLNNFIVIDSTVKLIDKLSQNYSIGMCTNNWIENTNYNKSVYPQIFEHFKFIVDSSVIRSRKPDTQIFIEVEKQSGAHGQEIYFIDDTLANIESAAKFGWQTYLFGDATELEKKLL